MKFDVTPELASLLKTMRARNRMSSKEVAERITKSPSYLSKLEGGAVRTIDHDMLKDMLTFIAGGGDFYDQVLPDVANLLFALEGGRFVDQVWFLQFDFVERPVTVSKDMSCDLVERMAALGTNAAEVTANINANFDSEMPESFLANQAISLEYNGNYRFLIRTDFEESAVEQVLSGEETQTSYLIAYNVARMILRMQLFPGVQSKLPPDQAITLLNATADYIDRWGIYSLGGFDRYLASGEFVNHQLPLVSSQSSVVDRIAAQLTEVAERDSLGAIGSLTSFLDTLDWDPAFALKLMGLPFSQLGAMSFTHKRALIGEITAIFERYEAMDELERRIETY